MSTKRTPEQSGNKAPDLKPEGIPQTPAKLQTPSSQQTDWVLHSLSLAHSKIDEMHGTVEDLARDVGEMKVQAAKDTGGMQTQMARDTGEMQAQMARDMGEVKEQMVRVEEALRPIPQMDKRLQAVEQSVLKIKIITKSILALVAIVGAIMGIARFLL